MSSEKRIRSFIIMVETYRIAAYTRISVDTEIDRDNTSI